MHNEKMLKLACDSLLQIFSAVSAKYYVDWFTVGKVITKIRRVYFFLRHSVAYVNFDM